MILQDVPKDYVDLQTDTRLDCLVWRYYWLIKVFEGLSLGSGYIGSYVAFLSSFHDRESLLLPVPEASACNRFICGRNGLC